MIALMSVTPLAHRVACGKLVSSALQQCDLSHKQAALICEVDFAEWSRAIHGLARFDLAWLVPLPWRFHAVFVPEYVRALARVHLAALKDDADFWTRSA
jgi:hypothetical protein